MPTRQTRFTLVFIAVVTLLRSLALSLIRRLLAGEVADPRRFWARQGIHVVGIVAIVSATHDIVGLPPITGPAIIGPLMPGT